MSERPALDRELCLYAELYATGEHVHTAANLLAVYLGEHALSEFRAERFYAAESRLRLFVRKLAFDARESACFAHAGERMLFSA